MRAKLSLLIGCLVLATLLAACHTAAGVGEDVSAAGHAVTRGATKVENHL